MIEVRRATIEELDDIINIEKECFPIAEAASEDDLRKRFEAFSENFIAQPRWRISNSIWTRCTATVS